MEGNHNLSCPILGPARRQTNVRSSLTEAARPFPARLYDFLAFTAAKKVEKLRYIHRNPMKRALVAEPQEWAWSSLRHYARDEAGLVLVNERLRSEIRARNLAGG